MVLAHSRVTILKSSNVSHGRPFHPKTNSSLTSWFLLLKMAAIFKLLVIYIIKLMIVYFRIIIKVDL